MRRKKNKITPTTGRLVVAVVVEVAESSVTTRGCDMGKTTAETEIYSMARGDGQNDSEEECDCTREGWGKKGI